MRGNFLVVDPANDFVVLRGLASQVRINILGLLIRNGPTNVNAIADLLALPQSSVSTNIQVLEDAGLVVTETRKARKGMQKICRAVYEEVIVKFKNDVATDIGEHVEVSMPLGLYSHCEVTSPCGICSTDGVIGLLDVPSSFLEPDRMKTALLWFTNGFVEYQFPNNINLVGKTCRAVEVSFEVSSEVPGTDPDWPSDVCVSINGVELGIWTSPGDFGDKRGVYTPGWWKLRGSQYGMLKSWTVSEDGTYVDGVRISDVTLQDLNLSSHRSIRVRIEVKADARHPGGLNIFGKGFGNYDQDIVLRLHSRL
jgi:predicted transcriptional regulator